MIVFTSCSTTNSKSFKKTLYTGTEGIVLNVYSNLPESVYEGEQVNYILKVINKGPYEVKNAKVLLTLEKGYLEFSDGSNINEINNVNLEGKTLSNNFDDFFVVEKTIKTKKIDAQSEYQETNILTSFCYDYGGILINDVCIDTDPYNSKSTKKTCSSGNLEFKEGQGGPLKISLIETKILTDDNYIKPQFKINFENVGNGIVIKKGSIDKVCNKDSLAEDVYNVINLKEISFSKFTKKDFECYPDELKLKQDQDSITCTLKSGLLTKNQPSFLTPLRVEIEYGYFITDSKNIKIKKILKY
ncbi:MAG: hypothetical protein QXM96_02835 [Candidatus Woesearchaeota archaeon]